MSMRLRPLKAYIDNSPRIRSVPAARMVEKTRSSVNWSVVNCTIGKFTVVGSGQERALAAKVRRESHITNRVDTSMHTR